MGMAGIVDLFGHRLFRAALSFSVSAQVEPCGLLPEPTSEEGERHPLKDGPILRFDERFQTRSGVAQFDGQVVAGDGFGGRTVGDAQGGFQDGQPI
jgi:hypothetical protein